VMPASVSISTKMQFLAPNTAMIVRTAVIFISAVPVPALAFAAPCVASRSAG
jgi:hypothetical protein